MYCSRKGGVGGGMYGCADTEADGGMGARIACWRYSLKGAAMALGATPAETLASRSGWRSREEWPIPTPTPTDGPAPEGAHGKDDRASLSGGPPDGVTDDFVTAWQDGMLTDVALLAAAHAAGATCGAARRVACARRALS